ncbi:VIT1/CCC1 transporter family protein [Microbacterium sp.]|uniref:VIT1/CCC1 transporter family protein n=1 Tax=Microbacterium sp. TaxID=51671 RepID=UPI003A8DAC3B
MTLDGSSQHLDEPHRARLAQRLNWLRAGVLGANDGIVSTAAVVVGVASAIAGALPVLLAGSAALVGGAVSRIATACPRSSASQARRRSREPDRHPQTPRPPRQEDQPAARDHVWKIRSLPPARSSRQSHLAIPRSSRRASFRRPPCPSACSLGGDLPT